MSAKTPAARLTNLFTILAWQTGVQHCTGTAGLIW
jgi:hypothetical protein